MRKDINISVPKSFNHPEIVHLSEHFFKHVEGDDPKPISFKVLKEHILSTSFHEDRLDLKISKPADKDFSGFIDYQGVRGL